MNESMNVEVLLSMQDNATPQLQNFNRELQTGLVQNKSALREMTAGVGYLGSAFLGMGISLKSSNNEAAKAAGGMLTMVGGMMTAVSAAVGFISAIAKMTSALQKLNIVQIIANALSGPGGWAKLAVGAAVAGGAIYGMTKLSQAGGAAQAAPPTVVNQYIAGSVLSQRELADSAHKGLLYKQGQNYNTGLRQ